MKIWRLYGKLCSFIVTCGDAEEEEALETCNAGIEDGSIERWTVELLTKDTLLRLLKASWVTYTGEVDVNGRGF